MWCILVSRDPVLYTDVPLIAMLQMINISLWLKYRYLLWEQLNFHFLYNIPKHIYYCWITLYSMQFVDLHIYEFSYWNVIFHTVLQHVIALWRQYPFLHCSLICHTSPPISTIQSSPCIISVINSMSMTWATWAT